MALLSIGEALKLGLQHHQAGELPRAEQIYRQILASEPTSADANHLLGALLLQKGQSEESLRLLATAVKLAPNVSDYQGNFGSALLAAGRNAEALGPLEAAVHIKPDFTDAHYNLGIVQHNLGRFDEALASYRRAVEMRPGDAYINNNLGDLLRKLGQWDEALVYLERSIAIDPHYASPHYNRALVWLSQGHLAEGLAEYEWRWRSFKFTGRELAAPLWNGAPLAEQSLLLRAEQGFGDTLQFVRYLPELDKRAPRVMCEVPPALVPLLEHSGFCNLVSQTAPLPSVDYQLPLLSLCRMLGTTLENIPAEIPYLTARADLVAEWREKLAGFRGMKVGIAWQGSPTYAEDRHRSIPLSFFAPLAQVPDVNLLSLQKGPGIEQLSLYRDQFHVVDLGGGIFGGHDEQAGPFMDTAAIMRNLDLVVTSDTVIAHLAGALGVRVWLALGISPDWRWMIDRADSPWYPTMRLFRQRRLGDWHQVFEDITRELRQLALERAG